MHQQACACARIPGLGGLSHHAIPSELYYPRSMQTKHFQGDLAHLLKAYRTAARAYQSFAPLVCHRNNSD